MLLPGLELFLVAFYELFGFRNDENRFEYSTLLAYTKEHGIRDEQRERLFSYLPKMSNAFNAHMATKNKSRAKADAAAAKLKAKMRGKDKR